MQYQVSNTVWAILISFHILALLVPGAIALAYEDYQNKHHPQLMHLEPEWTDELKAA